MKVKELIKLLADFDKDEDVFIGLGGFMIPDGASRLVGVADFTNKKASSDCPLGIYLFPIDVIEQG